MSSVPMPLVYPSTRDPAARRSNRSLSAARPRNPAVRPVLLNRDHAGTYSQISMLTLSNVRKSFGKIVAVDGLSLSVRKGEVLGLLGPNGAGKSTSVSLAVGLLAADAGTVTIEGHGSPSEPRVRQSIGVAPQALALYDLLTGEENLRFFGEVYGLSGDALDRRVAWCLDFVGLTDRKGDRAGGYSGGMKRRLNLAAAVLHDPELLLLDEPTVGVDPQSRNKIFESIEALHRDGRTVIYTTHYMEEAERLCDRIAIIDAGKLLALGTLGELLAAHGGPPTLVVKTNGSEQRMQTAAPLAELNRIAATATIDAFQMERPTLEQVFLRLTGRSLRD
jgi:ABC-2 type transport system ATP-binding protein